MTQLDLDLMRQTPGVYVLQCTQVPEVTMPVASIAGHVFALRANYELSTSADAYGETVRVLGGPFTAQGEALREQHEENLQGELEFWKDLAMRSLPAVRLYGILCKSAGDHKQADNMADIQRSVEEVNRADRVATQTIGQSQV